MSIVLILLLIVGVILFLKRPKSKECSHNYQKIGFSQEYDQRTNTRYSVRYYECSKCKQQKSIDTRYGDPYE